jgi:acyl-CoA thioesterase FadM
MRREFSFTHTVRYDECNCDGLLTPPAFVRYMQELAARDAEDAHLSGDGYWVVKRTMVAFAKPVPVHTELTLKTYGLGFTRITAQRGYEARLTADPQAEPVIAARTLWVYLDAQGRPARLPSETATIWLPDGPLAPQPDAPFPAFPVSEPSRIPALVRFSHVDLMRHLNNAASVELLDNAAWDVYARNGLTPETAKLEILSYDLEYIDSPRFGETLEIQTWLEPLPTSGQEFSRFQQITRAGKTVVRAHSRWLVS